MTLRFCALLVVGCAGLAASAYASDRAAELGRPNVLLIVADDLGYSDLGSYGSEISTPNLDRLARDGLRFTDFYVAPTCERTRATLMTGIDHHRALAGDDNTGGAASDGGQLALRASFRALPEVLRDEGYHTYMVGKWHLGTTLESGPERRGFDRAFVLPGGSGSHFSAQSATSRHPVVRYREDGKPAKLPADFYSSRFFTDKLIEYIESNREDRRPFFAYLAYTAPHWPLQAPDEFIAKYAGVYDAGYDSILRARLERQRELGITRFAARPVEIGLRPNRNPFARPWSKLDEATREREARLMQVYAAMVDAMDAQIGRLLDYLDAHGLSDNTVVMFLSDNGPEGNDVHFIQQNASWIPQTFDNRTPNLGRQNSHSTYGPAWAEVSAAPFRLYKATPSEGGVRVPAIFRWPTVRSGAAVRTPASVLDIAPTILEIVGARNATTAETSQASLKGISLVPLLRSPDRASVALDARVLGWEIYGRRGVRKGPYKAELMEPPYGDGKWQLYDLRSDAGQYQNLATFFPRVLKALVGDWEAYADSNEVTPGTVSEQKYGVLNEHYRR